MKSLTIRVSDEEHALMQAVARKRFMTITGIVRAHFHALCEADGATAPKVAEPDKPQAPASATPKLDDLRLSDGSFDNHRLVVRMRTHARRGTTRGQFAKEFGIGLDDMERACTEAAKAGHDGSIDEWHTNARRDDLRRLQLEANEPAQPFGA